MPISVRLLTWLAKNTNGVTSPKKSSTKSSARDPTINRANLQRFHWGTSQQKLWDLSTCFKWCPITNSCILARKCHYSVVCENTRHDWVPLSRKCQIDCQDSLCVCYRVQLDQRFAKNPCVRRRMAECSVTLCQCDEKECITSSCY